MVAVAQNLSLKKLKAVNCSIFSSLALAFSRLVAAMNDPEPIVAQKALSLLHTLADTSQRVLVLCLQLQFDCVVADRVHVINTLALLYKNIPSRGLLTWEFFAQRLNALHIEQQLSRDPTLPPVDIYGQTEVGNAALQRKVNMARFALKRSTIIRSISGDHETSEGSSTPDQAETGPNTSQADRERLDMKILSNLISLMMKFMAYDNQKLILDNRSSQRHQASDPSLIHPVQFVHALNCHSRLFQAVLLKHLEHLFRYTAIEQRFTTPAHILRSSASVNAFLSGLPLVMDVNLELGKLMLPTVLDLLRYLPSQDSDLRSQMSLQIPFETNPPQFTLGLLNTQMRFQWIQTLLIVLYKVANKRIFELYYEPF